MQANAFLRIHHGGQNHKLEKDWLSQTKTKFKI